MFAPIAGIIANIVEGVASNAITNRMQKGKANGRDDNDEIWELENGKITAIVRDGVRYVKEKTCRNMAKSIHDLMFSCSKCGFVISCGLYYTGDECYCPGCGARVVNDG